MTIVQITLPEDEAKKLHRLLSEQPRGRLERSICPFCMKIQGNWWNFSYPKPEEEQICSLCNYWIQLISQADEPVSIRIEGHHWTLETNKHGISGMLPFGGRKLYIRRFGSNTIEQVMLWANSKIPDWAKEDLPDNAEFIHGVFT